MSTVKPRKPKRSDAEILDSIDMKIHESACDFVNLHDFEFFRDSVKLSDASRKFNEGYWIKPKIKIGDLNVVLKYAAKNSCILWRQKLKSISNTTEALPEHWDRIKIAVEKLKHILKKDGVTVEVAERVIRTQVSINRTLMDGLPKRLRFWEKS